MAQCTYTPINKDLTGDNLYGPLVSVVDANRFWNDYGFSGNEDIWDGGWGHQQPSNTDFALARAYTAIYLLHSVVGGDYDAVVRTNIEDVRPGCVSEKGNALASWTSGIDDYMTLWLSFFGKSVGERAAVLVHEAVHASGIGHDATGPGTSEDQGDSSWEYGGAYAWEVSFLSALAADERVPDGLREQAVERANWCLDNCFAKHPGRTISRVAYRPGPAAVSREPNHVEVFYRGIDSALWHRYFTFGPGWSGEHRLEARLTSAPSALSRGPNHVQVFYRGVDEALWHCCWTGGPDWSAQLSAGGMLASAPSAVARDSDHIDVFYQGPDNAIWIRSFSEKGAGDWEFGGRVEAELTSAPAALSRDPNHLEVFYRGNDDSDNVNANALWHSFWNPTAGWSTQYLLGGVLTSAPSAVSRNPNHMEVFYRGQDKALWHLFWDPKTNRWSSHLKLGGVLTSAPSAVSREANHMEVFYRGQDNALWHLFWDPSNTPPWSSHIREEARIA